jgi:thiol-disulfide isomerase/thioredoxin
MSKKSFWIGYLTGVLLAAGCVLFYSHLMNAEDIQPVEVVHQLSLTDLEGKAFDLSETSGKPIIVNFWATWCKPCIKEFPHFQEARKKHNEVVVVVISDEPIEKLRSFKEEFGYDFIFLHSKNRLATHGINSIPLSYFYKAKGAYAFSISGSMEEEEVISNIERITQ